MSYSKQFLIDAYLWRFKGLDTKILEENANTYYDKVGKDKFRTAASLDASYLKEYKNACKSN